MKILKQIGIYILWIVLSIAFGMGYMRIVLGPNEVPSEGLGYLFYLFYTFGLLRLGLIIGSVIALFYIFTDIFYLKRKLENNKKSTVIRFLVFLVITVFVGVVHYILEKVIDII